jgi:dihydropteroate synthase
MGIVNVTPDSFSDGGDFIDPSLAARHALQLVAEAADIIDIGGESSRPGHTLVGAEEEQRRVLPVLRQLGPGFPVPISIDTWRADTARAALALGASMVNDVWGLQRDPEMAALVADHGCDVVVMHNRETVDAGIDIFDDLRRFFDRSLALARTAGIRDERIVLDPGYGFGKTLEQNLECLRRLPDLKAMGFRVLVGASRKASLGRLIGREAQPRDRLAATLAAHAYAIEKGADIVRVHDVREHVDAVRVLDAIHDLKGPRP